MAMYLGNQAVKILAPSINLFDKSLIQAHAADFDQCSEYEISADKNTIIARGNTSAASQDFTWSSGWVACGARSANNDGKGIKLSKGDVVTVSADFTLIEQGNKRAAVCCYLQSKHPSISITHANGKDISETPQRITWKLTVTDDAVDFHPVFPINSNKVKIENISVNKVKDYWRVRSGVNMGRNPKNLIPFPYVYKSQTINGITFTVQDDGGVKVEGTATANAQFYFAYGTFANIQTGVPITISGGEEKISVNLRRYDASGNSKWFIDSLGYSETGTLEQGERINSISIYVYAGTTCDTTIYPMLNEGTKALPYYYYD